MHKITTLLILLLLFAPMVIAQDDGSDAPPPITEQIDMIEQNTEFLRGLDPQGEVPVLFPSRDAVREFLSGEFAETFTPEAVEEMMAFYVAFEFLPPDFDIQAAVLNLYSQQVVGYYDPETKTMNVVTNEGQAPTGIMLLLDRITYSHEYVHALQDQYFDLSAYQDLMESSDNYDSNLAHQSLVEGDATFIMNEYTIQVTEENPLSAAIQLGIGMADSGSMFLPAGTPDIFVAELMFPYLEGERFVRAVFNDGGWEAVNAAYAAPPQSTEQILHPETYLNGDNPHVAELPVNAPDGYELALSGVLGEFYLREWLDSQLPSDDPVDLAATGWGGDTFNIYRNAENELAWELRLSWDTAADADEFSTVMAEFAAGRLPDSNRSVGDVSCWSGEMALCVVLVDATTIDVTFAPNVEIANALLN
jgi:hypothetical protein